MGLLSRLFSWDSKEKPVQVAKKARHAAARRGFFETMEPRTMMDADPIKLGLVYIEEDAGSDLHGDTFMIKFEGGDAGTQLTHLEINGDHGIPGLSVGDMIFDTIKGGLGADEAFPLKIVSQGGIQSVTFSVVDGTSILRFDFVGFHAGDTLVFSIDVDEVQDYDPAETNMSIVNEGIDPIASGVEFQGSMVTATFKEPHNYDITGSKEFRNLYDPLFAGSNLLNSDANPDSGLPYDNFQGKRDRSTGTMLTLQQVPLPISIAGRVFLENNLDLKQDPGEPGIQGVQLSLWKKVGNSYVDTGFKTNTNAQGDYEFGTDLKLGAGTYQVRETQPVEYYSVGAIPGTVSGTATGSTVQNNPDVLTEINIPRGGLYGIRYDFAEYSPSSLSGYVFLTDRDGNPANSTTPPIPLAGVLLELRDAQGNLLKTTLTDNNGYYKFSDLRPGNYTITEKTPDGLLDGDDFVGTINTAKVGTLSANDVISQITLGAGQNGVRYDFYEHEPGELSGYVYYDKNNNGLFEIDEAPIAGTTVRLFNSSGQQVGSTTTDGSGFYKFTGLSKDIYSVVETQPGGYLDGKDTAGTIGGQTVGLPTNPGDRIYQIDLRWGDAGFNYNFGEVLPASVSGRVFADLNGDCTYQPGTDNMLSGVKIELLNEFGVVISTTYTDVNGQYKFSDLYAGKYSVRETQPAGYLQGGTKPGSKGGDGSVQDLISQIILDPGDAAVEYNFCEKIPASISGMVYVDTIHNCAYDPGEQKLSGVKIILLNSAGQEVAFTYTDVNGFYKFDNLREGTYTLREEQPVGYLQGCQKAGNYGGDDTQTDVIGSVVLVGGAVGINYNFAELLPGMIAGVVFRDGAQIETQDGLPPDNLYDIRDGQLTADDYRIAGVYLQLRHTLTGEPVMTSEVMPGIYGYNGPLVAVTDANGYYEFRGLPQGNYTVIEIQPKDYFDAIDTAGTKGGIAVNKNSVVSNILVQTFALAGVSLNDDAILQIPLGAGQVSLHNNFSEVQVVKPSIPYPPPEPPKLPPPPPQQLLPLTPLPILRTPPPAPPPKPEIITGGGGEAYTWHLSVVDAGLPRVNGNGTRLRKVTYRQALHVDAVNWRADQMQAGIWRFDRTEGAEGVEGVVPESHIHFGMPGAIPITGDWDGDGTSEVGMFYEGEWFLDLNGNKRWDKDDLWAKLGSKSDLPVVGDWDGDGKDDIGIYGPEWPGDPRHIEFEPGLPDPENREVKARPKNVPPSVDQATDGDRLLRLTSQGNERADLIDHVFRFGEGNQYPLAGDWNGDGISTIGVFKDGKWQLDSNGDGRLTKADHEFEMGEKGDIPVVGDFNGDGIDEIGIYRAGRWIIDTNGNRKLDAEDMSFEMGTSVDRPVVGDFNGDGTDEPGVYREDGPSGVASNE